MFGRASYDRGVPPSCWQGWQENVDVESPAGAQAEYVVLPPRFRNDAGLLGVQPG